MPPFERDARVLSTTLVGLLAVAAFLPSLHNGFVYDDDLYVVKNPLIASWSLAHLREMLTVPYFGNFHPFHLIIYALERSVFGLNPFGWHAVSLLLHALNALLLYRILMSFGIEPGVAFGGAAIFAVHPIQAESVAWVSEQKNLLSLLFTLLSLKTYLSARASGHGWDLLSSVLMFLLALASKVSAVGLVPFLFAMEVMRPSFLPPGKGKAIKRLLPFVMLAGLWMNLEIFAHGNAGNIKSYPGGSLESTLLSIGPILLRYATNLLLLTSLSASYDLRPASEMSRGLLAGEWGLVVVIALALVFYVSRRRDTLIPLGTIWVGGFLLPVLNIVPIGPLLNDRYLYAPLCVFGPMTCAGIHKIASSATPGWRFRETLLSDVLVLAPLLIILSMISWNRSSVWKDELSLWSDSVANSPGSSQAHYNLGTIWHERGRDDWAEREFHAAVVADPTLPYAYNNLGAIHYQRKRFRLAAAEFRLATKLDPSQYDIWMGLAAAESAAGRTHEAIAAFQRASVLRPEAGEPYLGLGLLFERKGEVTAAVRDYRIFLSRKDGGKEQRRVAKEHLRRLKVRNRNRGAVRSDGTIIAILPTGKEDRCMDPLM